MAEESVQPEVQDNNQVASQTGDIDKLFNVVSSKGLYTKSKDEFRQKYSTPESIDKLFQVVSDKGLYTKSKGDFYSKYYPNLSSQPKTEQQVQPIQNAIDINQPIPIIQNVPKETSPYLKGLDFKTITDAIKADKSQQEQQNSTIGALYNSVVGGLGEAATGFLNRAAQSVPSSMGSVGGAPSGTMAGTTEDRAMAAKGIALATSDLIDKARTNASSRENEQSFNFDTNKGIIHNAKSLAFQLPRLAVDLGLGALTGGGSFFAQGEGAALEELKNNPEADKLTPNTQAGYVTTVGIVNGVLMKLGFDKIFKATGLEDLAAKRIINEVTSDLVKKGVKATTKDIEDAALRKATSFMTKANNVGIGALKSTLTGGGIGVVQAASDDAIKLLVDKASGVDVFNSEDIKENFPKHLLTSVIQGGATGLVMGLGHGMFENTNKAIRLKMAEAKTPQDIENIKQNINQQVESGNITPEQAQAANIKIQDYAQIAAKIPEEITSDRKYAIIGGIEQREGIKNEIQSTQDELNSTDEAFQSDKNAKLELLNAKLLQTNDYIDGLVTGEKTKYSEENGVYYKTDANGDKIPISKQHYELGSAAEKNDKKQTTQVQQPTETQKPTIETIGEVKPTTEKTETKELADKDLIPAYNKAEGFIIGDEARKSVGDVIGKINNAEYINENELDNASNHLYDLLDKHGDNKSFANLIEPLIHKIESYDFRTKSETSTVTERQATQVARPTREKTIANKSLEQWEGSNATITDEAGKTTKGKIKSENGKYYLYDNEGNKIHSIGEKALTDKHISIPSLEDVPNPVVFNENGTATVTLQLNKVDTERGGVYPNKKIKIEFNNPDKALDLAVQLRAEQIGEIPQPEFDTVYDEVQKEVTKEVPVKNLSKEKTAQKEVAPKVETKVTPTKTEPKEEKTAADTVHDDLLTHLGITEEPKGETKGEILSAEDTLKNIETKGVKASDETSLQVIKEKNKDNPLKTKIIEQATKASKALKSIFPNMEIHLHENDAEHDYVNEQVGNPKGTVGSFSFIKNEDGTYTGRIDINLNKANGRTIAHEVTHAILEKTFGENKELFKSFREKISSILTDETNDRLSSFSDNEHYASTDMTHEEYLAELSAALSDTKAKINPSTLEKVASVINKFVSKLTGGKFKPFEDIKNTKDVVDFFNKVSESIREGQDLSNISKDYEGKLYEQQNLNLTGKLEKELSPTGRKPKAKAAIKEGVDVEDHPIIDKNSMKGKRYSVTMSDHTKVGEYNNPKTGVKVSNLMGGVFYPYIKGIKDAGIGWASITTKALREMIQNASGQDATLVYRMSRSTGSRGNDSFKEAAFAELVKPVIDGKITEKEFLKQLNDKLNTVSGGKQLVAGEYFLGKHGTDTNKKITVGVFDKEGKRIQGKTKNIVKKEITSLDQLKSSLNKESFAKRGAFWSTLMKDSWSTKSTSDWYKFLEKNSVASLEDIANHLAESEVDNAADHDIVAAVKIAEPEYITDKKGNKIIKIYTTRKNLVNEEKGVFFIDAPNHSSYPYVAKGKPIGIFNEFNHISDYFPAIGKDVEFHKLKNNPYKAVETKGKDLVRTLEPKDVNLTESGRNPKEIKSKAQLPKEEVKPTEVSGIVATEDAFPVSELNKIPKGKLHKTEESQNKLKEDISKNGIKEPLTLVYYVKDNALRLKEGHHRLDAANKLRLQDVPIKVQVEWNNSIKEDRDIQGQELYQPPVPLDIESYEKRNYQPTNIKLSELGFKEKSVQEEVKPTEVKGSGGVGGDVKTMDDFDTFKDAVAYNVKRTADIGIDESEANYGDAKNINEIKSDLEKAGIQVEKVSQSSMSDGNYASFDGDKIKVTDENIPLQVLLHEIGEKVVLDLDKAKQKIEHSNNIFEAVTTYGASRGNDAFADNFYLYFLSPQTLKDLSPNVYAELDKLIPQNIKDLGKSLMSKYGVKEQTLKYNKPKVVEQSLKETTKEEVKPTEKLGISTKQQFSKGDQDSKIKDFIEIQRQKGISDKDIQAGLEKASEKIGIDKAKIDELMATPKVEQTGDLQSQYDGIKSNKAKKNFITKNFGEVSEEQLSDIVKNNTDLQTIKDKIDAIQKSGAGEVLQPAPQGNGSKGGKRGGMEQGEQGAEATTKKNGEENGDGQRVGISHKSLTELADKLGLEQPERGDVLTPEEYSERGKLLIKNGADPIKAAEEFKKDNKVNSDIISVARAHFNELVRDVNDARIKFGIDSEEYKKSLKEANDWAKNVVKPMGTAFYEIGSSLQGQVDLDTGNFVSVSMAVQEKTGKDLSTEQTKEVERLTTNVSDLNKKIQDLEKKLTDTISKGEEAKPKAKEGIKEKSKEIANVIRKGKLSKPDIFSSASPASLVWDAAIEITAKTVEVSGDIAQAIADGLEHIKNSDWYKNSDSDKQKAAQKAFRDFVQNQDIKIRFAEKKDNKFTTEEAKSIWEYAKEEYLDKGSDYREMLNGVSKDLGLNRDQVRTAISQPKGAKEITDEMYRNINKRNSAINEAKQWVEEQGNSKTKIFLKAVPSAFFKLKTFGHGTVGGITHAGTNIFQISKWKSYFPFFAKQFKYAFGDTAKYEMAMEDLKNDPQFTFWQRAGLAVDPKVKYDDYQGNFVDGDKKVNGIKKLFDRLGVAGDRGFNALKVYRLDLAKGFYDRLSNEEKADPNTAKEIAKLVNHSTGTSELDLGRGGVSKFVSTAFFAPKLEASRWQGLIGDPAKAAKTFTNWKEASPAEKAGAKLVARNAGEKIATYVALLAANSALLSLMGSKQKINYTNPLSSDWLKFKTGGGKTLDITGGTLASMKLLGTLLDNTVTGYTGNKKELWKKPAEKDYQAIGTQIRYKLSPFASTIADLVETTDAMGRPLPYSNIKPKKGETQYTVGSYLLQQQTPIPISAGIREAIGSMKERGMTNVQIQDALMGALYFTVEGFTGAKLGNEPKKKK